MTSDSYEVIHIFWSPLCNQSCCLHRGGRCGAEPYAELKVAAAEQMKITELRLAKLLPAPAAGPAGGRPRPPLGAGGVQPNPTAGSPSDAGAAAGQLAGADEAAAAAPGSSTAAAQAAERRSGRLRAHFLPRGGDAPGAVGPSPVAASPGVWPNVLSASRDAAALQRPPPAIVPAVLHGHRARDTGLLFDSAERASCADMGAIAETLVMVGGASRDSAVDRAAVTDHDAHAGHGLRQPGRRRAHQPAATAGRHTRCAPRSFRLLTAHTMRYGSMRAMSFSLERDC